jgi:hypothetical protein
MLAGLDLSKRSRGVAHRDDHNFGHKPKFLADENRP